MCNTIDGSNCGSSTVPISTGSDDQSAPDFQVAVQGQTSETAQSDAPNELPDEGYAGSGTPGRWLYTGSSPLTPLQQIPYGGHGARAGWNKADVRLRRTQHHRLRHLVRFLRLLLSRQRQHLGKTPARNIVRTSAMATMAPAQPTICWE